MSTDQPNSTDTIVPIHGLWMKPLSWSTGSIATALAATGCSRRRASTQ